MSFVIKTPNKNFNGRRFGVLFENGVGGTTDLKKALVLMANWGYSCPQLEKKLGLEGLEKADAKARIQKAVAEVSNASDKDVANVSQALSGEAGAESGKSDGAGDPGKADDTTNGDDAKSGNGKAAKPAGNKKL